jgi:hypothetical protein
MVQLGGNAIGTTWTVSLNSFTIGNLALARSWLGGVQAKVKINSNYFTRETRFRGIQARAISPSSLFC